MARAKVDANPNEAAEFLDAAVEALTEATAELRELARGIHPVVLTEGGLQPALRALVDRSSIPASSRDAPERALPGRRSRRAVYFVVAEALTNAVRYSDATRGRGERRQVDGRLRVTITDDGRGEADLLGLGRARHRG